MRELFVYYRVRSDQVEGARRAAYTFAARLSRELPQVRTRWLRRPDSTGEPAQPPTLQTWMEHHAVADAQDHAGVTPAMQVSIEMAAAGLLPFTDGPRHVEVFVPLPVVETPTV